MTVRKLDVSSKSSRQRTAAKQKLQVELQCMQIAKIGMACGVDGRGGAEQRTGCGWGRESGLSGLRVLLS